MGSQLKKPLPPNRTLEQVRNHYDVEKALADKLRRSSREERPAIYATMYDELFAKVPDHPRLTRRADERLNQYENARKRLLIDDLLTPDTVFAEFGPGDCSLGTAIAMRVAKVYGIDISDQRGDVATPDNLELIVYDGYSMPEIDLASVDVAFSDQLIEHFHPEDAPLHFEMVYRILKDGGKYVFRTPHPVRGPTDISGYFSNEPEGFHLKEWKFQELKKLLEAVGYSRVAGFWFRKGMKQRMPFAYFSALEMTLELLPRRLARTIGLSLCPQVTIVATK